MSIATIAWKNNTVRIIDQTKLPNKLEYIDCRDLQTLWDGIKRLSVRGAPAIGVAAAFGVLLGNKTFKGNDTKKFLKHILKVCDYIGTSRPTAVNLFNMLDRMKQCAIKHQDSSVTELKKNTRKILDPTFELNYK